MHIEKKVEISGKEISIETGKLAKQASGAVIIKCGGTVVLVTAVAEQNMREGLDFVPLSVEYREKMYAAGKIPGGFFKREGRPSTKETLSCRLIDRPIRPQFPKGYRFETQIIATVMSADPQVDPDVLSITGASAALMISDVPFSGPLAGIRVGRIDGKLIANPTREELENSDLELIIAGSRDAIVMVEGMADVVSEKDILEAMFFGHEALQPLLDIQIQMAGEINKTKREIPDAATDPELKNKVIEVAVEKMPEALKEPGKMERHAKIDAVWKEVYDVFLPEHEDRKGEIEAGLKEAEKNLIRKAIVEGGKRLDGRGVADVRDITCEIGLLPMTHGSGLFTRGETQVLGVITLGTKQDEQKIDALEGSWYKNFMLHYNFPPFSVGETSFRLAPGRREIGHGVLAERAVSAILPDQDDFPYTIRIVSEVLESNGSSSMGAVCSASLGLMDAGAPIKAQVAGIAMGLIKEGDDFFILTDILGDEDHCGDMDFKVAGTRDGITALQMDIKISGITKEIMGEALERAHVGRLHILDEMDKVISKPRETMSPHAPRIVSFFVPKEKIRDVIGPGGKVIRGIVEETGVTIDIDDDGKVNIASPNGEALERAEAIVREITAEPEVDKYYFGKVRKILDFGAFVEIIPGTDGFIHISQLEPHRVEVITDVLREGDEVIVKCIGVDQDGKVSLSRKAALGKSSEETGIDREPTLVERKPLPPPRPRDRDRGGRGGSRR